MSIKKTAVPTRETAVSYFTIYDFQFAIAINNRHSTIYAKGIENPSAFQLARTQGLSFCDLFAK
jgi:hypothetical protein